MTDVQVWHRSQQSGYLVSRWSARAVSPMFRKEETCCVRGADVRISKTLVTIDGGGHGMAVDVDGDEVLEVEAGRRKLQVLGRGVNVVDVGVAAAEGVDVGGPEAVGLEGVDGVGGEGDLDGEAGDVAIEIGGGDFGGDGDRR